MALWHIRIECWIHEARDTHSEYIIRISFPLQQLLEECNSLLRYMYTLRVLLLLPTADKM